MRLLGCTLIQFDWCYYKKRKCFVKTDLEGDGVRNWSDAAVIQRTLNRDSYYQKLESKEGFH